MCLAIAITLLRCLNLVQMPEHGVAGSRDLWSCYLS